MWNRVNLLIHMHLCVLFTSIPIIYGPVCQRCVCHRILLLSCPSGSNGSATFEEASTGINLRIRVIAKDDGLKAVTKRRITIPDGAPKACTVHQINETVIDGSTASFEFRGLGVIAFYECNIDRGPENFICEFK